jgi:type VI secretion system protein ImpL
MLASLLAPRRLFALVGLAIAALVVWFFGPWMQFDGWAPFAPEEARIGVAIGLFLLWLVWNLVAYWRARQANQRILKGLLDSEDLVALSGNGLPDDNAALREKFERAVEAMRATGTGDIYAMPWYVLIGSPGAGKTTLLRNSGLKFPVAEQMGADAIEGIGGTRNCDWWFAEDAVLLDTAGRFTSQDSDRAADAAAWRGFLDLLRRYRPRQPINGVLVAIGAEQLLDDRQDRRDNLVESIRGRLQELQRAFGLRLPVYLIVTKADLIPGFNETMDDLDRAMREQIVGVTLPLNASSDAEISRRLAEGFAEIERVALARMVWRLHEERDLGRRGVIFGFPHQLGRLLRSFGALAEGIFRVGRLDIRPLPRGAFLTSATQEGTSVDRLMGGLSRTLGAPVAAPMAASTAGAPQGKGRAYFIQELLTGLVFREAPLAGRNPRLEARLALAHSLGYMVALGGLAALVLGWVLSSAGSTARLEGVDRQANSLASELRRADVRPQLENEWPLLDRAAQLAEYTGRGGALAALARLGLPGAGSTNDDAADAYRRLLEIRLLPALLAEAERGINEAQNRGDMARLRQLLTVYLMLGTPERYDRTLVRAWVRSVIDQRFATSPPARSALLAHWQALEQIFPMAAPIDNRVVAGARSRLSDRPQAERIYDQLLREGDADPATPRIDVTRSIGTAGAQLILLRAQAGLPVVVSGFFTREGFFRNFIGRLPGLTFARESDDWVVGAMGAEDPGALQRLIDDVTARYVRDYSMAWQTVLEQTGMRDFPDLASATAAIGQLASPESPVARLIDLLRVHTDLAAPAIPAAGALTAASDAAARAGVETPVARLTRLLNGDTGPGGRRNWPGDRIRAPFANLIALTDARNGAAPITRVQDLAAAAFAMANGIETAQSSPAAAHAAGVRKVAGQTNDALSNLQALATTLPSPVSRIMSDLAARTWNQIMRQALEHANAAWTREVAPVCERAIAGRFPVERGSDRDIPLQDFRGFFGPDGTVNSFVRGYLEPFVQWRGTGYVPTSAEGVTLRLSREALENLGRARAVQQAFFGAGNFQFRFALAPRFLDSAATRAVLEIDTVRIVHAHDPPRTVEVTWPASGDASVVQLTLTAIGGSMRTTRLTGPWALFRVLARNATTTGRGGETYSLNFDINGMTARYALSGGSVVNPVDMRELQEFRCNPRL